RNVSKAQGESDIPITGSIEDDEDNDFNAAAYLEDVEGFDIEDSLDGFELPETDLENIEKHEDSYSHLPAKQREAVMSNPELGEADLANMVLARNSTVPKEEREFQQGINQSQRVNTERSQAQKEKLYLGRVLSFDDIKQ